jgi:1-acyl-sn-glycerol-3-phosphate acyltransferase
MTKIKAVLKITLFLVWCLLCAPTQFIYLLFVKGRSAYTLPYFWQRGVCKIFGIKVVVSGAPISTAQTVFCSNHISFLDIPVIGSVLKASFVAKGEVESWPVFGFLSKLQQTIFISRKRSDAHRAGQQIEQSLKQGKNIIIFPEGTSSDGSNVLGMKAALFSPLVGLKNTVIQPFTIWIKAVDKQPVAGASDPQKLRDLYAWYGDMELAPHLWAFAQHKGAVIELVFHAPIAADSGADRKALAALCEEKIRNPLVS